MKCKRRVACILLGALSGCESSYWVNRADLERLETASVPPATIPANRADGSGPVDLRTATIPIGPVPSPDGQVKVRPRNWTRRAGFITLGIGSLVAALGLVTWFVIPGPAGCHDEGCWLPQLAAGTSLLAIGGSTMVTGAILAGASGRSVEER
jgi:hypothetical protein